MSDDILLSSNSLLYRFKNVNEALPGSVVAQERGDRFHRQALEEEDPHPACNANGSGFLLVDVEQASAAGKTPCRRCFGPVLEHLASDEESAVQLRNGHFPPDIDSADDVVLEIPDRGVDEHHALTSLTEEVMIKGGASKVFHAPTPSGTLCGERGGYRTLERELIEDRRRPCSNCFHLDDE